MPASCSARRPARARGAPRCAALGAAPSSSAQRRARATRARLREVDLEAPLQLAHRGVAHVLAGRRARSAAWRAARSKITPWRSAPRAGLQLVDAEVRRQRVEDGQAAGDDGAPVVLQARQVERGRRCRPRGSARSASAGPAGVTRPSLMPLAASTCETAPTVPDEPSASRQWRGANGSSASSSSAPAATWASRKAALAEAAVGEVLHRQADAADAGTTRRGAAACRGRGSSRSSGRRCRSPAAAPSTAAGARRRRRSGALPRGPR